MKYNKTNNSNENSNAASKAASVNRFAREAHTYNIIVRPSARVLGGYMMTTEPLTLSQLTDFMVKVARDYIRYNETEDHKLYEIWAEDTENERLYINVEAWKHGRAIHHNVYDYRAEVFTVWSSKRQLTAAQVAEIIRENYEKEERAAREFAAAEAYEPEDHNRDNNPQSTTTTATEPENEPQPAPSFWHLFADYAAGTWYSITTRAPKYWHAITTAARRVFWWMLLLFCVLSAFAVFVLVLNLLSTTTPRLWVRWLFILPSAAVAGVYTLLYCKIVDATTDARRHW